MPRLLVRAPHPARLSPSPLGETSVCPSNPSSHLQTLPRCPQAELFLLNSLAHSVIVIYLLTLPFFDCLKDRLLVYSVPCSTRSSAYSRKGECGTPRAGKSTAIAGCCQFMTWTPIPPTPPRKANCLFLLCQVVTRRGNGEFSSLFPLGKNPVFGSVSNNKCGSFSL